ncbi:dolichyl-phosphate beta-glucosyltransferase [Teleopsis dalmanni]|uniref:dolichyl-phosphate beta-glucosyltransferase n=1 Tax=Teleopsis dalmanni TaxID=139649 RepID=UPI0018CE5DA6|nr:dolichyl-phosphate beta-glucosyltransferase [Teleopsis dalmanni]
MFFLEALQLISFIGGLLLAALLLLLYYVQKSVTTALPMIKRNKLEKYYFNPNTKLDEAFPSIDDEPSVDLSVIIPAYEEEKRLPSMLTESVCFLEERIKDGKFTYEIILVSDGSRDGTAKIGHEYSKKLTTEKFRVLNLLENRGKGGAVRLGMLSARGRNLLFADADGATKFSDLEKLEYGMKAFTADWRKDGLVVGSRAHLESEAVASRSLFRTFLMHGFHLLVWVFTVRSVRDTQCGFKLFTRSTARKLFHIMHVERWAFDVELLYLAERLRLPISEISVNWKEIDGSKLTPFWSWLQMGIDLLLIWFRYTTDIWQIPNKRHDN